MSRVQSPDASFQLDEGTALQRLQNGLELGLSISKLTASAHSAEILEAINKMELTFPMLTSEGAEDRVETLINTILQAVGDLPVGRGPACRDEINPSFFWLTLAHLLPRVDGSPRLPRVNRLQIGRPPSRGRRATWRRRSGGGRASTAEGRVREMKSPTDASSICEARISPVATASGDFL